MRTSDHKLTVGDLRRHLHKRSISPEAFAEEVRLSHMTIRRWLKRGDITPLPGKYDPILRPVFSGLSALSVNPPSSFNVTDLLNEIEKSGAQFKDFDSLKRDVTKTLKTVRLDKIFYEYSKMLLAALKSNKASLKTKALAAGALIYFVSPIDLIPDNIPVIGYMDDLAVLSLAVNSLISAQREEEKTSTEDHPSP